MEFLRLLRNSPEKYFLEKPNWYLKEEVKQVNQKNGKHTFIS